ASPKAHRCPPSQCRTSCAISAIYPQAVNPQKSGQNWSDKGIRVIEDEYDNDVWKGSATSKISLNHGVSGGLMLLQASTFWHELMWGLKSTTWNHINYIQEEKGANIATSKEIFEPVSKVVFNKIQSEITENRIPAHIWLRGGFNYANWIKDLWATASVGIHDYVTKKEWDKHKITIDLKEDPLAYLEILVDILQEWDRYTVLGESAFSGTELLQSYEIQLEPKKDFRDSKLVITYPGTRINKYEKNITESLDRILKNWRDYLVIQERKA
ncbi:MAG: hypothetical protein PHE55_11035, partial [Methylococcaceae bacterium]|nr:hypothetical protein [Methylococcaceae bacterium]